MSYAQCDSAASKTSWSLQKRIWYEAGRDGCRHAWRGTGRKDAGHERFRCGKCGAVMSEPLSQRPQRRRRVAPPPEYGACAACSKHVPSRSLEHAPYSPFKLICAACLDRLLTFNDHDEPFLFRLL